MTVIRPSRLRAGDTLAVVSLSAGLAALMPHRYATGKRQLAEAFGVTVVDAPNATRAPGYLRDNPQARADDLHWALSEPDVKGIVAAIGGDDSIRLTPLLDFDLIAANPKVFLGFSDTLATHLAFAKAGVVSFYGPAILTAFAENGGMHPYSVDAVRTALFQAEPYALTASTEWTEERLDWNDPSLQERRRRWWPSAGWQWLQGSEAVEGALIGGCAEALEIAKGTPVWPDESRWDGAVLHLELSEEAPEPWRVLHWMRNYAASGVLSRIGALLLSRPEEYTQLSTFRLWDGMQRVLAEAGRPDLPFVANLDYGHSSPMGVLPLGCRLRVDPVEGRIEVLQPGVQ